MAQSPNAGSAILEVVPEVTSGFGRKLTAKVEPEVEQSGEKAGGAFSAKFAAAGLVAAAALGASFAQGLSLEAGNDKLAAQLNLTEQTAKIAGDSAANLYKGAWGGSMEEVNSAISSVGSTLLDINATSQADLEKTTAKALDLATAFEIDVAEAVGSAGILMKTGLAKDSNEAFDLITRGLQGIPASVRADLLEAVNEYSVYFQEMGFSGEEAFGVLARGAEGGTIALDKTADAIKEFNIRSVDMSATSVAAYQAIGKDADKMSKRILAGGDSAKSAFQEILNGVLSMKDPVAQETAAVGFFGTQFEDLGSIDALRTLDPMKNALQNVGGAADEMGQKLNQNAQTNIESFKRQALMGLTEMIGGQVIPAFSNLTTEIGQHLGGNVEHVKTVIIGATAAMALAVTIHAVTVVAGWAAMGVAATVNAAKMVAGWVMATASAVASAATTGAIYALYIAGWLAMGTQALVNAAKVVAGWVMTGVSAVAAGALMGVQVVIMIAGWVLLGTQALINAAKVAAAWLISMGPIALVVAAVVAVVALIIANWDTIVNVISAGWELVKSATSATWDFITGAIGAALGFIVRLFMNFTGVGLMIKHWDDIKGGARAAWDWITDRVNQFVGFFMGLPGRIGSATLGLFDGIKDAFRAAINWVIDKWNNLRLSIPSVDTKIPGVGTVGGFSLDTPDIPRFAKGGIARGTFIAGEDGAEIVTTDRAARVFSHDDSLKMMTGARTEKHYHYHNESKNKDPLAEEFREMERLQLPIGL